MAIARAEQTTKVTLNVETAVDTYKNRIFSNINPAITDAKVAEIFGLSTTSTSSLAAMQSKTVNKLKRADSCTLAEN